MAAAVKILLPAEVVLIVAVELVIAGGKGGCEESNEFFKIALDYSLTRINPQ